MNVHADSVRDEDDRLHQPESASPFFSSPSISTTALKHTRQRSNSCGPTFYSSTIVPAPFHGEALSSLITSLTTLSDAPKPIATLSAKTSTAAPLTPALGEERVGRIAIESHFQRAFYDQKTSVDGGEADRLDACPPPVAGYNTINADPTLVRPKTASADKPSRRFKFPRARNQPKLARSQNAIHTVKSRKDLGSLESPSAPRTSGGNESLASLSLSTTSKLSSTKNPFNMFFASRLGSEHSYPDSVTTLAKSPTSLETAPTSPAKESEARGVSTLGPSSKTSTDIESNDMDARPLSSRSPNLSDNIIPSRRSSLRSGHKRSSKGSKDLRSLNIDQDLIEENHGTVQRIRELREARERRHHEWGKEAKRSERASAKRSSMPGSANASPIKTSGSLRSSWHPAAAAAAAAAINPGDRPVLLGRLDSSDLAQMPAFVENREAECVTPVDGEHPAADFTGVRRNLSLSGSTTQSMSSPKRHRKRLSDTIKRASSVRSPIPDDVKGITEEVDAYLASSRLTQKIRHPRTGRTIAFSEVGDPNGFAVFCCVGMGLTRYVSSFYDDIARTHKLRIITPDRPGVGETEALPADRTAPLSWVDDVAVICAHLGIDKFSLLAHSAGAIYALATALKMPQYVRGRIHLLGPWIPPSQLAVSDQNGDLKAANLPTSHKILSFLPASFMKAANSRFLSATSASIEPRVLKSRKRDRATAPELELDPELLNYEASLSTADFQQGHMLPTPDSSPHQATKQPNLSCYQAEQARSPPQSPTPGALPALRTQTLSPTPTAYSVSASRTPSRQHTGPSLTPEARQKLYNTTLTHRTWSLATLNANPAIDLIICLERKKPIGFRYTDITRAVVIHHGTNDNRVPLENVRWLSKAMKRCELRVLENEGHGLMASATVMANVLSEVGKEWEEWNKVVAEQERERKRQEKAEQEEARERERAFRRGFRSGEPIQPPERQPAQRTLVVASYVYTSMSAA